MSAATLEELADKADEIARRMKEPPTFVAVRTALNEAGIYAARNDLADALKALADAQGSKRSADSLERTARDELDKAMVSADWELDGRFTSSGNKTLLDGEKAMTADERKAWKAREALKDPAVAKAASHLRQMEYGTAVARDALVLADKRLAACRAGLDAAIAILEALCLALPVRKAE